MLVSLFTDASFCHVTKVGGYGAWARCEHGVISEGGPMKRELDSSNEAEARACFAGLLLIARAKWWSEIDKVLVQLDNSHVIRILHKKGMTDPGIDNPKDRAFLKSVMEFEKEHGVIVMAKHVKGHVKKRDGVARHHINRKTDKMAKRGLKVAREWSGKDYRT